MNHSEPATRVQKAKGKRAFKAFALLLGIGALVFTGAQVALALPITIIDDAGPDDEPGQKDLNQLTVDFDTVGSEDIIVTWNWDVITVSGNNTADACALFDTDNDGNANYSLCVIWGNGASYQTMRLYNCGDAEADRCTNPRPLLAQDNNADGDVADAGEALVGGPYASTCTLAVVADTFGARGGSPQASTASDTQATCKIFLSDFGGVDAFLLNVCSYPSQVPGSDPSDCVITPNSGFLTIVKAADPDDGTQFVFNVSEGSNICDSAKPPTCTSSWTITGSDSVNLISYGATTTLDLSEVVPAGWQLDSAGCVLSDSTVTGTPGATGVTDLAIQTGRETRCTFTNSKLAKLTLEKSVKNDNGGDSVPANWTLMADGTGTNDLSGPGPSVSGNVQADTFTLSETAVAGYSLTSLTCNGGTLTGDQLTLVAGDDVTCTFVNDDDAASLKLIKHVVNDNGGTATADQWTVSAGMNDVTGSETAVEATDQVGTYALSETSVAGYTNTSITCDDDPGVGVTSVTVGLGETIVCTFVNDDDAASLKLIKHVVNDNGGTATADQWTVSAGMNDVTGSETAVEATDQVGTYALSETSVAGYTNTSITCDDDPGVGVTSVTVGLGETIVCTFVNDDDAASLKLIKHVVNDNGGTATADQWTVSAGMNDVTGSETAVEATDQVGTYALSETSVAGYTNTSITCDDDPGVGVTSVTVGLGETIVCTFVNDDDAASLKLIKHVVNDNGGTATADQWTVSAGMNDVTGSETAVEATDQVGTYALSETSVAGYTNTSITCDDDPGVGVTSVTVGLGETIVCTFVNDDDAASLKLIKHVVNDNGGTATADQWTVSAGMNDVTGSETAVEATDQVGTYALSETSVAGYTNTSITCDDDPGVGVTSVTVGLGETIVCTFVNDDDAASLKLIKHVVNDNGGTATADQWTVSAGMNDVTGSETAVEATDQVGTYALSETSVAGYTNTSITCDDDPGVGVTSVTVGLGETIVCTFVNDDDAASLKLIKHVVNDNGGTATADQWTVSAGMNDVTGSETAVEATDQVGTYALSETSVAGYTNTSITCDDDPGVGVTSVTVGLGETIVCTFVNDDDAASLKLIKHVVNDNGGTATADQWTVSAGMNDVTGSETAVEATDQVGTYALSETSVAGYTNTSITCDDDPGVGVTSVTVGLGETIVCTFVNDDDAASLKLIKHVVNDNGGTATADQWTVSAGMNDVTGSETAVEATDQVGTYALSETSVAGYTNTSITCDDDPGVGVTSVTVGLGETIVCTFVNDDDAASLKLIKHVVNDNGGTATADQWTVSAGMNDVTGSETAVEATDQVGTYALSETSVAGYTNTSITCDDDPGVGVTSVTVGLGETIVCTFVNDDDAASLKLIKHVVNDNGGTATADQWTVSAGMNDVTGSETAVEATDQVGTYALSETSVAGYTNTSITCDDDPGVGVTSVTVGLGETIVCTFVNDDDAASLKLIKHVVNDNGGTATADQWTVSAGMNDVTGSETAVEATDQVGTYALSETSVAGYTNTSITCDDDPGVGVTSVTVGLGETIVCTFVNDDDAPKVDPHTIGFWKNWSSCDGKGKQAPILDETLAAAGGIIMGAVKIDECEDAVNLLDKRDLDGKKRANDAAYGLAAQLLAAELNAQAGAYVCPAAAKAIADAQVLLAAPLGIDFNGTGAYLDSKVKGALAQIRRDANALASTLDRYNNGNLC